jgi:hypothetical protein
MKALIAALALATLIAVPTFAHPVNAAPHWQVDID